METQDTTPGTTGNAGAAILNNTANPPKAKLTKPQTWLLVALLLGIFIGGMDTGVVSPARTVIEDNLQIVPT